MLDLKKDKSLKEMTLEERAEYKRKKKKMRMLQVYGEIGAIVLGVALLIVLVAASKGKSHVAKDVQTKEQVALEASVEPEEQKHEEGLKVQAMAGEDPDAEKPEAEEEETAKAGRPSAEETENTKAIPGEVISSYGILINNDNDQIVAKKNAYDRMIPASMTKVMTVYTAWNHMDHDKLSDKVVMSSEAADACYKADCATSGFVVGEEVTVKDLFFGTILPSGGDAATQLAMYVGGDVDSFMDLVNQDLAELGLSDTTHFTNPIGYYDDNHYSTVYDIAMIMKASMEDEFLAEVLSTHVYYSTASNINPEGIIISNWFLRRIEDKSFGGTILGAKTGYVNESGSCAVSCETSESGVMYICCTAKSTSSWNAINDHVKIYSAYGK